MTPVTNQSCPASKIALFRSLFRGREDVYPRRFESRRSGKTGYSPACANEWVSGVCEKPRVKCAACPNRRFRPVTDEVVRQHLSGSDGGGQPFVVGVYPMLLDETCYFLAIDFDGETWHVDALAYLDTCRRLKVPAALERSRSGNGGHVWLFFSEALPAATIRKLGSFLLTETMDRQPDLGFGSYDRFFPNQDTLPNGGFGNLIALPLQHQPRSVGNSVFVDDELAVIGDQWELLSSLKRIPRSEVESIVDEASRRGRVLGVRGVNGDEDADAPWDAPPSRRRADEVEGPLPKRLDIVLGDQIYVPKEELSAPLRNRLLRLAAFQNPEFYRAQAMRLPTYDKPRIIACGENLSRFISLPRGCEEELRALLKKLGIEIKFEDERIEGTPLELSFRGTLRPEQETAVEALLAHETGVLSATTAFGKTVIAANLIARRGVNTLVLVHRTQLMDQWVERLTQFLDLPAKGIGRLGGGRKKLTGNVDVALLQSVVRKGVVDDRIAGYGQIIVDECHHVSASGFEQAVRRAKAKYVIGLSATVTRKDGHQPIVFMQCGPVRHRVDARHQAAIRPFSQKVIVRPTGFLHPEVPDPDRRVEFQRIYKGLIDDDARNRMICDDVVSVVEEGRSPLVLTERTNHLERLADELQERNIDVVTLRGGMAKKVTAEALQKISRASRGARLVVVATGRFVGEGFDDSRLDTLFLTLPVSWRGTIAQYAGRLHRLHEGKREVRVYDYADLNLPMLSRMFDRRCRGYEAVGYTILLPASALPGWPQEVPLPVDPKWKQDYAASVRRLIGDGVDQPLADLFVWAAREFDHDAEGVERARSASEAFLYRRLQTLDSTRNRFRLNQNLPIVFAGRSHVEIDFLDEENSLVIELDGAQHLADRDAYRRDRKKDWLLQENGYHVLRFLAEDVGVRLDEVLDEILRALTHLSKRRRSTDQDTQEVFNWRS